MKRWSLHHQDELFNQITMYKVFALSATTHILEHYSSLLWNPVKRSRVPFTHLCEKGCTNGRACVFNVLWQQNVSGPPCWHRFPSCPSCAKLITSIHLKSGSFDMTLAVEQHHWSNFINHWDSCCWGGMAESVTLVHRRIDTVPFISSGGRAEERGMTRSKAYHDEDFQPLYMGHPLDQLIYIATHD